MQLENVIYCRTEDAEPIYRDASRLNLTDSGFAWFVTEQALLPANAPAGNHNKLNYVRNLIKF